MAFDEDSLARRYNLTNFRVRSSTQIASRTAAVISNLTQQTTDSEKSVIVILAADAKVASKLISVVEIVKRDLVSKGLKCFQYNALSSQIVEVPRESKKKKGGGGGEDSPPGDDGADGEEGDEFQTMADPMGATKKRNTPFMTIYLSCVAVKELRAVYG
ncbi:hypothetical protein B0A55_03669 [Friedmanniomyces simplex]|uniref:DNA/RNA-binding protein Alba-like domain-containing protein n=1 Tax=Friedmanniomyces simplex TaxID=329884 RepID=A0A4U0XQT0_9PEZI|nr:hypothetical protein B0A55_03669 [Friedmanniomyces simplex]